MKTRILLNGIRSTLVLHSFAYLCVTTLVQLISLLTIPLLTIILTPLEIGMAGIYLAVTKGAYWCMEFSKLAQISYVRSQGEVSAQRANNISALLSICVMIAIVACAVLMLFRGDISHWIPISPLLIIMAVLNGFFLAWLSVQYGLWQVSQSAYQYSLFKIALSLLNLWLLGLGLFFFSFGWESIAWANLMSAFVIFLLSFRRSTLRYSIRLAFDKKILAEYFKSIAAFIPLRIGIGIFDCAGTILVSYYAGIGAGGLYLLAYQITAIIPLIHDSIISAIIPSLISKNQAALSKNFAKTLIYAYMAILSGLAIFVIYMAPLLIRWLASPEYYSASLFIPGLIIARVFSAISALLSEMILYKTPCLKQVSICNFLVACIYVATTILLLKQYGEIGGSIGLAIGYGIWLMITVVFVLRISSLSRKDG